MKIGIGSTIYAARPGDGSAREQAAACQRVIGAWANQALEYATKRYRSNLINWGMLPLLIKGEPVFKRDEYIFIPDVIDAILKGKTELKAYAIGAAVTEFIVTTGELTMEEKRILTAGCLINYYKLLGQKAE